MRIPKVCRICLVSDVKLLKYERFELKNYYEQLMVTKINNKDGLPRHFCNECAALLYKFHKFRDKCFNGQKVFKELMRERPITLKSIRSIDRHANNLQSSLSIITANHKVRTFIIKSKQTPKVRKSPSPVKIDFETESSCSEKYIIVNLEDENLSLPELAEIDKKLEDDEDICKEIKVDVKEVDVVEENASLADDFCDRVLADDEKISNEGDNIPDDDLPADTETIDDDDVEQIEKEPDIVVEKNKKNAKGTKKKKRRKDSEKNRKVKRFEITKKKTELDPNNWLKFNLSEEEAIEEFKARSQHKRFISAEFKCNDCLKGFSKEDMLNRHIKLRHSETVGPIECRFCRMRFKWNCFLRKHMRQHYTKYKCLRCDLVCPLETTALFHEEYHNGVIRKCTHCDEEFKHLTTYYTHLRTHRSEHVCTLCGASFVSAIGLRIHKKIKHVNAESTVTEGMEGDEEYCKRCDIKFETRKAYEEHLSHSAMHVDGLEDLEVEAPVGPNPRKRRRNQNRRLTRIPTNCHICGKHFATQAACRKHHLAEHPRTSFFAPNERHICEICGISLAPGSVSSHLNTHTREKLYSCSTCGKQFSSKGGMTTHQLTHTSEKPVGCTLCEKRFKQLSSMRLHYRTFHLKEPYPKRNRKKKPEEISKLDEYPHEEADENIAIDRWR